jgi:hypothetical protein
MGFVASLQQGVWPPRARRRQGSYSRGNIARRAGARQGLAAAVGGMRVATKAGYPAWVSLLFLVPVVDLVVLLVVAFSKWPVERRLEQATRYRPSAQAFVQPRLTLVR